MKQVTTIVVMAVALCSFAVAQRTSPSAHEQAAIELLEVMDIERQMLSGATAMADAMIAGNPTLLPYRDVLLEWAASFMTWETFGPAIVELYVEAFDESELKEMTAFYRSPVGKKALDLQPKLMNQAMELGMRESQTRVGELQEMVKRRAMELASSQSENSAGND